jgi:hypothetical protein
MFDRALVLTFVRQVMADDESVDEFVRESGDKELSRMVFHQTIGDQNNLRLSSTGYEFLKRAFEYYEMRFEEDYNVTARDLLYLKATCTCPYYIALRAKPKYIGLFERELAARVKLVSGNLSLLV